MHPAVAQKVKDAFRQMELMAEAVEQSDWLACCSVLFPTGVRVHEIQKRETSHLRLQSAAHQSQSVCYTGVGARP